MGTVTTNCQFDWSAEKSKWDSYFGDLPLLEEDDCTARFNAEFVEAVSALLPKGGRTLEAGCGAAWQSLALARQPGFQASLLDFSSKALEYARRVFEREHLPAQFIQDDLSSPSKPEFDLVFNAGVLEHYTFDEQVNLVRGMKARSRRYVIVLVPNRACYWYWVWRQFRSRRDAWPWGKEIPMSSMARVFEEAGLQFHGERYFGAAWTESFITESLPDTSEATGARVISALKEELLAVHRSPIVPMAEKAYLIAALGSVGPESDSSAGWNVPGWPDTTAESQLTAALCDALALKHRSNEPPPAPPPPVDQLPIERERFQSEKRTLLQTLDTVATQITELQSEKRALTGQMRALEQETAKYREDQSVHRGRSEALTQLLHEREERHQSQSDRLLDLSTSVRDREATIKTLLEEEARSRKDRADLEAKLMAAVTATKAAESQIALREEQAAKAELAAAKQFHADLDAQRTAATVRAQELKAHFERQFEAMRTDWVAAVTQFDTVLGQMLATVRSQRAWHIMLLIRKAYAQWVREGWRGKLAALGVPFEALFNSSTSLQRFDIHFPSVWDSIPHSIACEEPSTTRVVGQAVSPVAVETAKYDVVILPIFDFEFRFQRPQQIAAEFARSGHRVYWVSPSRCNASSTLPETVPLRDNIYEVRLPVPPKNIYTEALTTEQADALTQSILTLFRANNIAESIVVVQFPYWRQVALNLRKSVGSRVIYDCMDDWTNWTADPRISEFALAEERKLATEADLTVATSAELHSRLEKQCGRKVLRIRNGADFPFFNKASACGLLENIPHPIAGYYGAVADWVDVDLMTKIARDRPQYSFVIIGEVHNVDTSALRKLPNVHLLGEKNYRLIPSYLAEFDVCTLPFMRNTLTQAVDPVKVYEYLSQGKPVVATRLPEVCDHRDVIYLADREDFAEQLDRALSEDTAEKRLKRISYARENSWAGRVSSLNSAVEKAFPLVSILVVAYKSRDYLAPLLDSIRRNTAYPNYEVIVVDNCSDDGSAEFLHQQAGEYDRLRVINLDVNKGFAASNNFAAQHARGDFLVLLNADTIVPWGWLERLMRPLRNDASIGVTAPVTNFSGNETRIETTYRNLDEMQLFAKELADRKFGELLDVSMAPLHCAMVSRKLWDEAGDLDEKFGLGMFEDDDFALRVKRLGYRIVAVEDCFLHHFGNGSFKTLSPADALALFEKNKAYFEKKWSQSWRPHTTRAGVRPPAQADRYSPASFCRDSLSRDFPSRDRKGAMGQPVSLVALVRLHPESATVGSPVNLQPDGSSAIVVACQGAIPGTVIKFGENMLQTSYGSATLLSGELPAGFNRHPATIPVTLINDFGPSNTVTFRVEGENS